MPQKLSNLPDGSKIKFITFWGAPIVWKTVGRNLTKMPDNSTTLFSDKVLAVLPFDAAEPKNSDANRQKYGNNDYTVSNIRQWLNSDKPAGQWYSPQHPADQAPDKSHVSYNAYDTLAGFLNFATAEERSVLLDTERTISSGKTCTDKVFIPVADEMSLQGKNDRSFPGYENADDRRAMATPQCTSHNEYSSATYQGYTFYQTATIGNSGNTTTFLAINYNGVGDQKSANDGSAGIRPVCNISSDQLVSDTRDEDDCYTFIYNWPPTAPSAIVVPEKVNALKPFTVTWGEGTDPEGAVISYTLQRKTRSTDWANVYIGSQRSFENTVPLGSGTVQYRVCTNDAAGLSSGWTTSPERVVSDNQAPVVALNDPVPQTVTDAPPTSQYTVTDPDGDAVTAREYVDGSLVKTHQPELGHTYDLKMDSSNWVEVLNGTHTYSVEAEDPDGETDTKQVTWVKDVDGVSFKLSKPLKADERPTKAVLTYAGLVPPDAYLKIEICNNGNDEEPAWLDATEAARRGSKIYFTNETKTADEWGVDIRVQLDRQGSMDPVYLSSISGNYA